MTSWKNLCSLNLVMNLWQCAQFDIQTFPWHLIHLTFLCWAKGTLYGPRLRRLKVPRSQQFCQTNGVLHNVTRYLRLPYLQSNKSKMLCWFTLVFKILHVNHVTCIQSTISDVRKNNKRPCLKLRLTKSWLEPKPSTEPIRPQQGLRAKSDQRKVRGASYIIQYVLCSNLLETVVDPMEKM